MPSHFIPLHCGTSTVSLMEVMMKRALACSVVMLTSLSAAPPAVTEAQNGRTPPPVEQARAAKVEALYAQFPVAEQLLFGDYSSVADLFDPSVVRGRVSPLGTTEGLGGAVQMIFGVTMFGSVIQDRPAAV